LGPTTAVIPGSKRSVVAEAKDLKPFMVRDLRCTLSGPSLPSVAHPPSTRQGGCVRETLPGGYAVSGDLANACLGELAR